MRFSLGGYLTTVDGRARGPADEKRECGDERRALPGSGVAFVTSGAVGLAAGKLAGQRKGDVLGDALQGPDALGAEILQPLDDFVNEDLGRGSARGHADARLAGEPFGAQLGGVVDH